MVQLLPADRLVGQLFDSGKTELLPVSEILDMVTVELPVFVTVTGTTALLVPYT